MAAVPDRIWVPAAAALLLALAFVGALLVRTGGDPSILVHAGAPCTTQRSMPPLPSCDATVDRTSPMLAIGSDGARGSLTVQPADQAFDGQFFYRLGVSPWSKAGRVAGVQNDLPALRNARWGYGALAFVGSAGDPDLVPWSLIGVNLAAAAAVGAIGGGLARSGGRHAAWGLVLFLWPGFAYSLSLDTSELVASAFLLGGLLALRARRWIVAALALSAAVLTRDTTTVVPFGVLLAGSWAARPSGQDRPAGARTAAAGAAALATFAGWQLVQRARFGQLPLTSSGDNNLSGPLAGLAHELGRALPPSSGEDAFRLACTTGLLGLLAVSAWVLLRARPLRIDAETVSWAGATAVVVLLNAYLWSGATAFMRASTEAGLLSLLILLRGRDRWALRLCSAGVTGLWLLTVAAQLSKVG